jgi:hypothetical protein
MSQLNTQWTGELMVPTELTSSCRVDELSHLLLFVVCSPPHHWGTLITRCRNIFFGLYGSFSRVLMSFSPNIAVEWETLLFSCSGDFGIEFPLRKLAVMVFLWVKFLQVNAGIIPLNRPRSHVHPFWFIYSRRIGRCCIITFFNYMHLVPSQRVRCV